MLNWTLDLGVARIMLHCLRYRNAIINEWMNEQTNKWIRGSPLHKVIWTTLCVLFFCPFQQWNRLCVEWKKTFLLSTEKYQENWLSFVSVFPPISPNVHFHFWVNYTFKNISVSEKLEIGNPQQINRTGWEHSVGRTHIYPVSQNKDLVSKFVNLVVCLVMPMTQKICSVHTSCTLQNLWLNQKQNTDIYLQSKTTQDEHQRETEWKRQATEWLNNRVTLASLMYYYSFRFIKIIKKYIYFLINKYI